MSVKRKHPREVFEWWTGTESWFASPCERLLGGDFPSRDRSVVEAVEVLVLRLHRGVHKAR